MRGRRKVRESWSQSSTSDMQLTVGLTDHVRVFGQERCRTQNTTYLIAHMQYREHYGKVSPILQKGKKKK